MAKNSQPLRGRSELIRPDGTIVPVRDYDGTLLIDEAEWEEAKKHAAPRAQSGVWYSGGAEQRNCPPCGPVMRKRKSARQR